MFKPLISICIPTYNQCELLTKIIDSIVNSEVFLNTNDIEIVISNNCSTDNTDEICKKYLEKFPDKIKYIKQQEPLLSNINIFKTIKYASGIYCKLNNDNCSYKDNSLDRIVECLKTNNKDCTFLFNKDTRFKYMLTNFYINPYFYLSYFIHILKLIWRTFIKIEKNSTHRNYKILGFIKFKIRLKQAKPSYWKSKNKHNNTWLINSFQSEKILVGKATYGPIDAVFSGTGDEKLIIGNFCSIANGVKFLVSSEHSYKGLSTYPFKVYYLGYELEATGKGSIIVKDDVWIGANALILSGVTIGQGAIIGAGAVVTKDVPPYAIVGGNPAKVIKYRFEPEIIEKLVKFDFSKLSEEKIKVLGEKLYTEITKDNIDDLIKVFSK